MPATFTFAGLSFDDVNTPTEVSVLQPGNYAGAIVTNVATTTTEVPVAFPDAPATGFNPAQSLGSRVLGSTGVRPLNLPSGNNGTINRAGLTLGYGAGTAIGNGVGNDVLIYESGNRRPAEPFSDPEPMMIQARIAATGEYTRWFYKPAEAFGYYTGSATIGAFATQIDLTDLGVPAGTLVDQFRLVNMTDEDRMDSATGIGFVRPEDAGATSTFLPTPGPQSTFTAFDATSYDPDPLYFAALQPVTTTGTNIQVAQTITPAGPNLVAGTPVTLTVTVTNAGTVPATGVPFTAALPSQLTGVTYTSTTTGGATGNTPSGTGAPTATLALPAGATTTYTITGIIAPTATGAATFTTAVGQPTAPVFDSNLADNTATTTATIQTVGDLAVTVSNPTLTAGQPATFTITVTNSGPSTVTAPLGVNFPGGLTGVTYTSAATGGATGNTSPGTNAPSDTLTVPAGATVVYTVTGTVSPTASGPVTTTVSVTPPAGVTDPTPTNNTATAATTVVPGPANRNPVAGTATGAATSGATPVPAVIDARKFATDPDGNPLAVTAVGTPANGTARINPDGTITYTPNTTFTGTDTFPYTVSDGAGGTATGTVSVAVTSGNGGNGGGTNRPPVSVADTPTTTAGGGVTFDVLANDSDPDGDPINVSVLGTPANGTAALTSGGRITYTPRAGFVGTDVFSYTISDGRGGTATSSVSVTVRAASNTAGGTVVPPVSRPDRYSVGSGVGESTRAILFKPDGTPQLVVQPFESTYTAGVRVATGDVTGDGIPDLITVPADGGGPRVTVFDGATGARVFDQFLYEPEARVGLYVAVGDVTGDGRADIILSPGAGGGPRVRVYDFKNGQVVGNFFAYEDAYRGGARVAVGDMDGDGVGEIITAPGAGRAADVRTFTLAGVARAGGFTVPGTTGVSVAAGDFTGTSAAEIAVGSAPNGGLPVVTTYTAAGSKLASFQAYEDAYTAGVPVATYTPVGARSRIVTGTGFGGGPRVQDFGADGTGLQLNRFQLGEDDRGGVHVG